MISGHSIPSDVYESLEKSKKSKNKKKKHKSHSIEKIVLKKSLTYWICNLCIKLASIATLIYVLVWLKEVFYQKIRKDSEPVASSSSIDWGTALTWCRSTAKDLQVVPGKSWGGVRSTKTKTKWHEYKCQDLLLNGRPLNCTEKWGFEMFENWRSRVDDPLVSLPSPSSVSKATVSLKKPDMLLYRDRSNISCITNVFGSRFCKFTNVVVDFSKMKDGLHSRFFDDGFMTSYIDITTSFDLSDLPNFIPGLSVQYIDSGNQKPNSTNRLCQRRESRPTFILSNDDPFNLGHYINDVMGVWSMIVLSRKKRILKLFEIKLKLFL